MDHPLTKGNVLKIIDGDTFWIAIGPSVAFKYRLANCNTPEVGEPNYQKAKDFTADAILGKAVRLQNHNQQIDIYGRRLASVWYGSNYSQNLALNLLEANLATPDATKISFEVEENFD